MDFVCEHLSLVCEHLPLTQDLCMNVQTQALDGQGDCGCAVVRSGARNSIDVLLSYYVVICSDVRVGVVQCGLVTPAW